MVTLTRERKITILMKAYVRPVTARELTNILFPNNQNQSNRDYEPEVREWAVGIYNEYGKQMHRYIGNITKENELFFLYDTDSEFRNASYDYYSRLIKKISFLKDQTEMLFLFIKDYHRVESEQRFSRGIPSISEEITDWVDKTWAKH